MTTAAEPVFIDTNVLLTATAPARLLHRQALDVLDRWPARGFRLCTSGQVQREYLVVATRPVTVNGLGLTLDHALENAVRILGRMRFLDEDRKVADRLAGLLVEVSSTGRQIHDANIIATMLRHGVGQLVSANAGDFERFAEHVRIRALGTA